MCQRLFLIKLQAWGLQLYYKRFWRRCFSCEFCEIFENTFFIEHLGGCFYCSQKLYVIHWKIPAPDSLLNEVVDLQPASLLLRKWLRHRRFPVNLQSFSEELYCNTSARLLLSMNMWASDFKKLSCGSKYSRMCQVKFAGDSLEKVWSDLVCWGRPCQFKFFKSCLPQYLLGIFLNTLTHVYGGNKFRFLFGQIS